MSYKPDLLLTQIKHCDYPIFRATLKKHRDFFGKIIVYFNENNRLPYLDHFIQSEMQDLDCIFLDQSDIDWGTQDWRNVSTNEMLQYSSSEWVCSVEQDWFSKDWDRLLKAVEDSMKENDLLGWYSQAGSGGGYIHPSFWFIKRSLLDQTNKNFSANNGEDHFGHISQDAKKLGAKIFGIQDAGFKCDVGTDADAFHLGGVNQNYLNWDNPHHIFHRPEAFMVYNYWCRKANVNQSIKFLNVSNLVEERLKKDFPDLDFENNEWNKFFI